MVAYATGCRGERHGLQLPLSELRGLQPHLTVRSQDADISACLHNTLRLSSLTSRVGCRQASCLAGRGPSRHFNYLQAFYTPARRPCLRAPSIFALCSDHCKKNNGSNERNAFVNPFWVETDLNPFIKPYRQYYSAFIAPETASHTSDSSRIVVPEFHTLNDQPTTSTGSQEGEASSSTSISRQSSESLETSQSLASNSNILQDSRNTIEEVAEERRQSREARTRYSL